MYSRLRLREFGGLSTFQFLAFFRRALFYTFLAIFLKKLGLGTTEVTLMATVGMIANSGTQAFLWGPLFDRTPRAAWFVIIGEFIAGIGHIILYYVFDGFLGQGMPRLAGYTIIFGLGIVEVFWSMSNVGWSALLSELTTTTERKQLMAQLSVIGGIGSIVGTSVGAIEFQDGVGFLNGVLFFYPAVIMIISSFIVYLTIDVSTSAQVDEVKPMNPPLSSLDREIRNTYLLFILALVFINFGRNSVAIIMNLHLDDPTGLDATDYEIGIFNVVGSVAIIVAGIVIGSVMAKVDDRKVMRLGTISALAGLLILMFAPSYMLAIPAAVFVRGAQVVIQASSYSIVANLAPVEYRGRLFAYYNTTFFLSWGIGATLITGPLADILIRNGFSNGMAYRFSFFAAFLLVLIGLVILAFSFKRIERST